MTENIEQSKPLSPKLQRFVEAFLETWNATEAARIAQYKSPEKQGPRIVHREYIQAAIQKRLAESAMPADEVLTRITQHASVNPGDFFHYKEITVTNDETGESHTRLVQDGLNWEMVKTHGHLIKKISFNKQGKPTIEVVDNQKALELLGKHHRLFIDQVDMNVHAAVKGYVGISPDDWDEDSGQ